MNTLLYRKLGIAGGSRVLLLGAPRGFVIDPLPEDVTVHRRRGNGRYDVVLAFCGNAGHLRARFAPTIDAVTVAGGLWVCWPKRASGVPTDLTDNVVREHGLATGLVDVKVVAVNEIWSALKFVRRRADRPAS